MNALWSYFWPILAAGLVIGAIAGLIAFRESTGGRIIALALGGSIAAAAMWHGPIGAADAFATQVERNARETLHDWEMDQVQPRLGRNPLTRQLLLSGAADDFQRGGLVEIMSSIPGVGRATWSSEERALPLIAEAALAALVGCLLGLLLAYLVALRRRYNAEWKW